MRTVEKIAMSPEPAERVVLPDGSQVGIRTLRPGDADAFGRFLSTLNPETRRFYNPHPLTAEHAATACASIGRDGTVRVIALRGAEILAYVLVGSEFPDDERKRYADQGLVLDDADGRIAPVVHPTARGGRLGTAIMDWTAGLARRAGLRRLVLFGGTQTSNVPALAMYRRLGYTELAEFRTAKANNVDMYLDLG